MADAPAGQAFADIIVGRHLQAQSTCPCSEGTEALAADTGRFDGDGVLRQARLAIALGDFASEHGTDGAVDVPDLGVDDTARAVLSAGSASAIRV